MTDTHDKAVAFDSTEGLLYRALCVMIERHQGHMTIPIADLEAAAGQFVVSATEDGLVLSTLKRENDSEH